MAAASLNSTPADELDFEYKYVNRDAIDKDLCCAICTEPFLNPLAVPGCEHIFCKACIERIPNATCPTCRASFDPKDAKPAHRLIVKQLEALQVHCNSDKCSWTGTRENHVSHRKECKFEEVTCPFVKFGCSFAGSRAQVETHLDSDCKFKEVKGFLENYIAMEKKVAYLEKKVEELQKSPASSSPSSSPFFFMPGPVRRAPPTTSPAEEAQLKALHEAAMAHTKSRVQKEEEERKKKEAERATQNSNSTTESTSSSNETSTNQ